MEKDDKKENKMKKYYVEADGLDQKIFMAESVSHAAKLYMAYLKKKFSFDRKSYYLGQILWVSEAGFKKAVMNWGTESQLDASTILRTTEVLRKLGAKDDVWLAEKMDRYFASKSAWIEPKTHKAALKNQLLRRVNA